MEETKEKKSVEQSIRDRFEGVNDPVALKVLKKIEEVDKPKHPTDQSLTTLFIGGVLKTISKADIR